MAALLFVGCTHKDYTAIASKSKEISLKLYPQQEYLCGPSAIYSVLDYRAVPFNEKEIIDSTFTPKLKGSLEYELSATLRSYGLIVYKPDSFDGIIAELSNNNPVILLLNLGTDSFPVWHYSVAFGFDGSREKIFLSSTDGKKIEFDFERFEKIFQKSGKKAILAMPQNTLPNSIDTKNILLAIDEYKNGTKDIIGTKKTLTSLLSKYPKDTTVMFALANLYYEEGEYQSATSMYKEILKNEPTNPQNLNNLANSLLRQNRASEALIYAKKAVEIGGIYLQIYKRTKTEIEDFLKGKK